MRPVTYRAYRPEDRLVPFVEACWHVQAAAAGRHLVVPDGCIDVIFSPRMGLQIVGAMTSWAEVDFVPGEWVVGVRFRPGAARPFLRASPGEFTDRRQPVEDVWGRAGRLLHEQVGNASSALQALWVLASQLRSSPFPRQAIPGAVSSILAGGGAAPIQEVAQRANLSTRQLRRVCLDETGLSPKQLARVIRFRRAGRLLATGGTHGGASVAAECGYYDQAHLIRDFQLLAGRTPSEWLVVGVSP